MWFIVPKNVEGIRVWNGQSVSVTKNEKKRMVWTLNGEDVIEIFQKERDIMKKVELSEWGYPIHPESDCSKPPEGDFGKWVGLILVFTVMSLGVLKIGGIIFFKIIKRSIFKKF